MERKNNSEEFIKKIFERSEDPIAQLEKINSIVPIFFANEQNVASANKRLDSFGFQINDDYVSGMRNQYQMFGHPSCGVGNGYGNGHPSCCSSKNERGKSLLLIRKNSSGIRNEIRN